MDAFCTVNEMAEKWELSPRRVQKFCAQGRIHGVRKLGRSWMIPRDARRPIDQRCAKNQEDIQEDNILDFHMELDDLKHVDAPKLDFRQALQIDFRGKRYERILGRSYVQLALELLWECPLELKKEYPLGMLRLAWGLADNRYRDVYVQLLEECQTVIEEYECPEQEKEQLQGEYEFLKAFLFFPDFHKMLTGLQRAASLCRKPLRCVDPAASLTFGGYSPWCVFRMKRGHLENEIVAFSEAMTYINKLGKGLGAGLDTLFHAETLFFRGEIEQAEILGYEAMYEAETNGQDSVCLGVYSLLGHVAIQRCKKELWTSMIDKIHSLGRMPSRHRERNRRMADLIEGELLNSADNPDKIAEWIKDSLGVMREMPGPMLELATYVHISYLYHKKMYVRALGVVRGALLNNAYGLQGMRPFIRLFGAACEKALGNHENSKNYFLWTAKYQDPSNVVLIYAEFKSILGDVVEECMRNFPEILKKINAISDSYARGWQETRALLSSFLLPQDLTRREYEVAWEAAQGYSNAEIAQKLNIAVNTVRGHMRQIFEKLEITKRSQLKKILNTK